MLSGAATTATTAATNKIVRRVTIGMPLLRPRVLVIYRPLSSRS